MHWVCVTFVVLPARGEGRRDISAQRKHHRNEKSRWKESGAFFLTVVSTVEERLVEYARCLCILCACMSVVKGYVVFSADRSTSERKNWSDRMQRAFAFVTVKNALCCVSMASLQSEKCKDSVVPPKE